MLQFIFPCGTLYEFAGVNSCLQIRFDTFSVKVSKILIFFVKLTKFSWTCHASIKFTLPRERKWNLGVSLMTSNFNFTKFLKNCFCLLFAVLLTVFNHRMPFTLLLAQFSKTVLLGRRWVAGSSDWSAFQSRSVVPSTDQSEATGNVDARLASALRLLLIGQQIAAGARMFTKSKQWWKTKQEKLKNEKNWSVLQMNSSSR